MNQRRGYTEDEKTELLAFDSQGPRGWQPLMDKTRRSRTSLQQMRWKLRREEAERAVPQPPMLSTCAKRKCLSCSERFPSEHIGHRVCEACKASDTWSSGADFSVVDVSKT